MPAPTLNFVPKGPGWPGSRPVGPVLKNRGQGSGPPIEPQKFAFNRSSGGGIDGMGSMGDWVDLNSITQPNMPAGPWTPPSPEARYGPWKSAPLAPQPVQVQGGRGPLAETSPWAVPAPSIPLKGVGDWMELSGLGGWLPDRRHWFYVAGAVALGLGFCWLKKNKKR